MKGALNSKLQYLYIKVAQQLLLKLVTVLFLRFIRYHEQRILLVNLMQMEQSFLKKDFAVSFFFV